MAEKETAAPWLLPYPTSAGEVKNGATDIEELANRLTTVFKEKLLITKKYAGSETLKSGELAVQESTGKTFTLPSAATADQVIAMFSTVAELKVTSASEIVGDFQAAATCKLTTNQHLLVQSTGVKWVILAGEPKREQAYVAAKTFSNVEMAAGVEPSATRAATVLMKSNAVEGGLTVGGIALLTGGFNVPISFRCLPGQKIKATIGGGQKDEIQWVLD